MTNDQALGDTTKDRQIAALRINLIIAQSQAARSDELQAAWDEEIERRKFLESALSEARAENTDLKAAVRDVRKKWSDLHASALARAESAEQQLQALQQETETARNTLRAGVPSVEPTHIPTAGEA